MNHNTHDGEKKAEEPKADAPQEEHSCLVCAITAAIKARYPDVDNSKRQEIRDSIARVAGALMAGAADQEQDRFQKIKADVEAKCLFTASLARMFGGLDDPANGMTVRDAGPGVTIIAFDLGG